MRVVLDARKLGDGGIGVYLENLISGLCDLNLDGLELNLLVQSKELISGNREHELELLSEWSKLGAERFRVYEEHSGKYSLSEYFSLAKNQRKLLQRADIFHSPHYTLPYRLGIPAVVTIHDVIHVTKPDTFLHRPIATQLLRSASRRAAHILTVSHASLARIKKVLGHSGTPVTVVPNALRRDLDRGSELENNQTRMRIAAGKSYMIFVGSDRPHKNFQELLHAWKIFTDRRIEADHGTFTLIAVGSRFNDETKRMASQLGISEQVLFAGDLSTAELGALYRGSSGVIVPSLEEGFGLVALEAMAMETPIICTPEASLRELCGNAAWYADGFDRVALADILRGMFTQNELREGKLREGKERSELYTRQAGARATLGVYVEVLGERGFDLTSIRGAAPRDLGAKEAFGRSVYSHHLRRAETRE